MGVARLESRASTPCSRDLIKVTSWPRSSSKTAWWTGVNTRSWGGETGVGSAILSRWAMILGEDSVSRRKGAGVVMCRGSGQTQRRRKVMGCNGCEWGSCESNQLVKKRPFLPRLQISRYHSVISRVKLKGVGERRAVQIGLSRAWKLKGQQTPCEEGALGRFDVGRKDKQNRNSLGVGDRWTTEPSVEIYRWWSRWRRKRAGDAAEVETRDGVLRGEEGEGERKTRV